MNPPFPWNGAKTRLLKQLLEYLRAWGGKGRWVEPFLGSGVVSRYVRELFPHVPMFVGDSNPWLMAAHQYWLSGAVSPATLEVVSIEAIQRYRNMTHADFGLLSTREQALRFLVCLYSAWGNRWQTTPEGVFVTPINTARKGGDAAFLLRRLQESHGSGWFQSSDLLRTGNWRETAAMATEGDLVFLDSPYPETAGYSTGWTLKDWSEMYLWVRDHALPQGISVLVCNPETLSLLWRELLSFEDLYHAPSQGRSAVPRIEYIGYQGPFAEPEVELWASSV